MLTVPAMTTKAAASTNTTMVSEEIVNVKQGETALAAPAVLPTETTALPLYPVVTIHLAVLVFAVAGAESNSAAAAATDTLTSLVLAASIIIKQQQPQ